MWDLNYNDLLYPSWLTSTYSAYDLMSRFAVQRELLDMLNDTTDFPKINRAESRKHIREIRRRNRINIRIQSLLGRVPMDERLSFTKEELIELRKINNNKASYDYWPISKSVTRRLRGLVKKQNGRIIIVSLGEFLTIMPPSLNETEI